MRLKNKQKKFAGMVILFLLLSRFTVFAADGLAVVETYTGEFEAVLYLRGVEGDISDISVQAGTVACDSVTQSRLAESSQPVKTLIMLDNSLSIPKSDRKSVLKVIRNMIADRMDNEQMAVATFGEGLVYLAEYTADDASLLHAVDEITFQNANTYLTDVLYDVLTEEYIQKKEDVFFRMIVISDGMDNKSLGYTKEEFFDLLKEYPVPIYTVGVQTSKKKNNEQLKNMFAVSRMTEAQSFILGDMENLLEMNEAMNEDRNIVRLSVMPQQELMDGSRKTLKITLATGESVSAEIVMPQQANTADLISPDMEMPADDGEPEDAQKDKASNGNLWMILLAVCLLAVAVVIVVILAIMKRRKQESGPAVYEQPPQPHRNSADDASETEILNIAEEDDGDHTVLMWNSGASRSYHLTLTDIHTASRSFQTPLRGAVVIGRKQGVCGIVIDYDMSVSGKHCEIRERNGRFYITDLQSSNGTYVDGLRISSETEITSGSVIKMGKLEFRFDVR